LWHARGARVRVSAPRFCKAHAAGARNLSAEVRRRDRARRDGRSCCGVRRMRVLP
jgi:hypothetical protein